MKDSVDVPNALLQRMVNILQDLPYSRVGAVLNELQVIIVKKGEHERTAGLFGGKRIPDKDIDQSRGGQPLHGGDESPPERAS